MSTQSRPSTEADIRQIHVRALAVYNQLYYENTGKVYRGTRDGRLKEEKALITAETTIIDHTAELTDHEERITVAEAELIRLETIKADKCYVTAMSLILG